MQLLLIFKFLTKSNNAVNFFSFEILSSLFMFSGNASVNDRFCLGHWRIQIGQWRPKIDQKNDPNVFFISSWICLRSLDRSLPHKFSEMLDPPLIAAVTYPEMHSTKSSIESNMVIYCVHFHNAHFKFSAPVNRYSTGNLLTLRKNRSKLTVLRVTFR